jgi:hypothetical protein
MATLYNDNGENKIAREYSVKSFLTNPGGKDIPIINQKSNFNNV